MIKSMADLLNEFVAKEVEILNEQDIKHPPTIGGMFEGLTEEVLNRSLFNGLDLKVVKNSFIVGCDTEFDVLLVEGEGEKIPYSDRYKYYPKQVIAVIQVKKNLYSKDIEEGFDNLQFLINYFKPRTPEEFVERLFRDSFRAICKKDITAKKLRELTLEEDFIFHTLKIEAFLPVRIIWGYNGFVSEYSFREKFVEYLNRNLTTDLNKKITGFGPHNFPNLIICGKYSIIKNNGMPFVASLTKDRWWPFLTTSSFNPTYFFLELIWTRLSYKFELPMVIFGDDLTIEPHTRFIDCKIKEIDGNYGWEYNYFAASKETLIENTKVSEWKPVELDATQYIIINELCNKGEINLNADKDLEKFVKSRSYSSLEEFLEKLKLTGLVYIENNVLKLLTDQCQCAILPDGRFIAGENKSGRLERWMRKELERIKK